MQVTCHELGEFIGNLQHTEPSKVLERVIWVSITSRPLDTSNKRDAVKFGVVFQASAVVNLGDGGQYLLHYGEDCGVDYRDKSQELLGSERSTLLKKKLVEFCDDFGLRIRPGIVGE